MSSVLKTLQIFAPSLHFLISSLLCSCVPRLFCSCVPELHWRERSRASVTHGWFFREDRRTCFAPLLLKPLCHATSLLLTQGTHLHTLARLDTLCHAPAHMSTFCTPCVRVSHLVHAHTFVHMMCARFAQLYTPFFLCLCLYLHDTVSTSRLTAHIPGLLWCFS